MHLVKDSGFVGDGDEVDDTVRDDAVGSGRGEGDRGDVGLDEGDGVGGGVGGFDFGGAGEHVLRW